MGSGFIPSDCDCSSRTCSCPIAMRHNRAYCASVEASTLKMLACELHHHQKLKSSSLTPQLCSSKAWHMYFYSTKGSVMVEDCSTYKCDKIVRLSHFAVGLPPAYAFASVL